MSSLYDDLRQSALTGGFNWTDGTKTYGVLLIDTSEYSVNFSADAHVSDIPSGGILARADLTTPTATAGAAGADPVTVDSVTGTVGALVIYEHADTDADSVLIAYIDEGSNIPSTYEEGTVSIVWDSSGNGIFKL